MPENIPTPPVVEKYLRTYYGYYGMLGEYATQVKYLQSSLNLGELNDITLVDTIPGSNEWSVRELFQRGVNEARVKNEICTYFKRLDQQKFFNPLTIVVLPMQGNRVAENIKETGLYDEKKYEDEYQIIEAKDFYKIRKHKDAPQYSQLLINPDTVKLIAIDGQHRLSALKSLKRDLHDDRRNDELKQVNFKDWSIPVVLLILPVVPTATADILKSMRDIFVTINKQAKEPTKAQNILLDDFDVNSICTQEFLDYCHKDESSKIPLFFFDWMGARELITQDDIRISFMDIEELYNLHQYYFITDSKKNNPFTIQQKLELNSEEIIEGPIDLAQRGWDEAIRKCYTKNCLESIVNFFTKFRPTKDYVNALVRLVKNAKTPYQKDALYKITYGKLSDIENRNYAEITAINDQIIRYKNKTKHELDKLGLFGFDIGLRGVLSGFRMLKDFYIKNMEDIPSYEKYMKWYLGRINNVYKDGHLRRNNENLNLIAVNKSKDWSIINYKYSHQSTRLGAYCAFFVAADEYNKKGKESWKNTAFEFLEIIEDPLKRAYKPLVRERIDQEMYTYQEYLDEVTKQANAMAQEHIKKLHKESKLPAKK